MPKAILGIDAAWTAEKPSGVALVIKKDSHSHLVCVASSFAEFHGHAGRKYNTDKLSRKSECALELLYSAKILCGQSVDIVSADIPLSHTPITGRRTSDDAISKAFGSRHASTHSPNASRPGRIAEELKAQFERACYPLRTSGIFERGLVECYPHPALIEYLQADERLPYKVSRISKYWKKETSTQRKENLVCVWKKIIYFLDKKIAGVKAAMPIQISDFRTGTDWKAFEDKLDAIICAAVGISILERNAIPYGDEDSAIWVPTAEGSATRSH